MSQMVVWGDIWCQPEVRSAARKARHRIFCVAYVTRVVKGLFRRGDVLVCDASETARAAGETDPRELLKLAKDGVAVYSLKDLHVKCAVMGDCVLVGSANMSESSASRLTDMSVLSRDKTLAADVKAFVTGLTDGPAEKLDLATLGKMAKEFNPKLNGWGGRKKRRRSALTRRKDWLMSVRDMVRGLSDAECKQVNVHGREARKDSTDKPWWRPGSADWYQTSRLEELKCVSPGDRLIMIDHSDYPQKTRADVYGPCVVYLVEKIGRRCVVHYTRPRHSTNFSDFKRNRFVREVFPKGVANYPNRRLKPETFETMCRALGR